MTWNPMVRAGPVQFPVVLRRGGRKKGGNTKLLPEIAKNGKKITGKCQRKTVNLPYKPTLAPTDTDTYMDRQTDTLGQHNTYLLTSP